MCKVHNPVGCLTTVKTHLRSHGVNDFNSLNEVVNFQKNFPNLKQQIILNHEQLIEKEKITLEKEITHLDDTIKEYKIYFESMFRSEIEEITKKLNNLSVPSRFNFIQRFFIPVKQWSLKRKIQSLEYSLDDKVNQAIKNLIDQKLNKTDRYQFITQHFRDAVNESCSNEISELEKKLLIIEEVKTSIYGAIGEHKVVKELENLSDENILINDFTLSFHPAIYNRMENDYIKSIQIDHLLITPSGIFIIETKNWSEKSLESLDLRSPVQQVRRSNFAFFKTLTEDISNGRLQLHQHHWGDRKIPIRNLIVLTNTRPNEEFQYVKVLTLDELLSYINYFKPQFTNGKVQTIESYLLNLN